MASRARGGRLASPDPQALGFRGTPLGMVERRRASSLYSPRGFRLRLLPWSGSYILEV